MDLQAIIEQFSLNSENDNSDIVIEALDNIERAYSIEEMIVVYNYILQNFKNPDVLMHILRRIDRYKLSSTLDILLELLLWKESFANNLQESEKYVNLRSNVARVISNFKNQKAVLPLLYCLNNKEENYKVRLACAEALGKIGDKYAVSPLIEVVSNENEKSIYLRESAVQALGMIGDSRAIDSLVNILEAKKTFLDRFTFLKERVIEALGRLDSSNERVFLALKNSLEDESPQVRMNAIDALSTSDDERAFPLIVKCINDADYDVAESAILAVFSMAEGGEDYLLDIINFDTYTKQAKDIAAEVLASNSEDGENDDQ